MQKNQNVPNEGAKPSHTHVARSSTLGHRTKSGVLWSAALRRSRRQRLSAQSATLFRRCLVAWLAPVLVLVAPRAPAEELPLWEVALGVLPSTFPAYRGSRDQNYYVLPFPYLIYRGEIFQSDRKGIRAKLFESERIHLNISMNGSIPVKSDNDSVRKGMPDLDPTLEIGPTLRICLTTPSPYCSFSLNLPVRSVIATDFGGMDQIGWVFNPHLNLESQNNWGGWTFALNAGPLLATSKYHDYYYQVKPEFALSDRPEYRPSAGYSGAVGLGSFSRRFNNYWVGGFVRYDYLGGAEFDNSPLIETKHSVMAGVAIAWFFAKSSRKVER